MWLGAEYIAKQTNSNIGVFNIVGTPFPSLNLYENQIKSSAVKTQIIHRYKEKIFENANKDIVFINLRMPYHFGDEWYQDKYTKFIELETNKVFDKKSYFKKWLNALESFSKNLDKKGVSVVLSYPTPEFPYALTKQCKEQNPNWFNKLSKKDCTSPIEFFNSRNGKYSSMISEIQKLANRNNNIYLLDTLSALCPNSICTYSYKNQNLYKMTIILAIMHHDL